jgi:hypothetical protein
MVFRLAILLICSFIWGCNGNGGDNGGNGEMPPPLGDTYPIDGVVDLSDFEMVYERDVEIRDNAGQGAVIKTTTLRWAITNDDRNIYFALEWTDDTYDHDYDIDLGPLIFDGIKLLFDNDGNGTLENGEDERTVIAASIGSQYVDQHASSGDETDLIGDGFSKLSYDPPTTIYQAEFLFPLTSDAEGQDADLSQLTRYNIILFEEMDLHNGTGNMGSTYGLGNDSTTWPDLPLIAAQAHDYPEIPSGLTGLIVFLSDHEESNRDIYSLDPSTGEVSRVTKLPTLFKENVSLSHDRTKIAFHGADDRDDYTTYEIYVIDIDGTNLTRLTDNTILDGHPGWSPDDSRIVYASFREGGIASMSIMETDGTEIIDLTPAGMDDNDPDFLPDGRIVFKTDRFSDFPQLRIAVMNDDGSGVLQLTHIDDVVDHDPVGDRTYTIFERLPKGIHYATNVEAFFSPWDIVEAQLDGGDEQTLLSDGWINWLPVYDPSGEYICYLKGSGYTAAYLMTRDGEQLGRFIPDITRLNYIDWK